MNSTILQNTVKHTEIMRQVLFSDPRGDLQSRTYFKRKMFRLPLPMTL